MAHSGKSFKWFRILGLVLSLGGLFVLQGCKDTPKSSSQQVKASKKSADKEELDKLTPVQQANQDAALEKSLEHRIDDAKTTQRVDRIVDEENAIQDATQGTGPLYTPQNGNILQNWTNHQDNLASPLNHNY